MRYLAVNFTWQMVEVVDADGVAERVFAMVPSRKYRRIAANQFHEGEEYPLAPLEARSRASHAQFFAALHDGFSNLPEDVNLIRRRLNVRDVPEDGWLNAEHLRKWCLIETGFCDVDEVDYETAKDASTAARLLRRSDNQRPERMRDYFRIAVRGSKLIIRTAKSQSTRNMGKEPFEESKRAVLDLVEAMCALKKGTLNKEAGKAA